MESGLRAYVVEPDGSARDANGQLIFFAYERFKSEVCRRGHCFVCGVAPSNSFNNEHVFPNWLLRHCGIHNATLTLSNEQKVKYSTYLIGCCQRCNSLLGDTVEAPVSEVIRGGYDALVAFIQSGGYTKVAMWLALVFLKAHLRDFRNAISPDRRKNLGVIGDTYDLNELHHIHAIARAATAGVAIDDRVYGSLSVVRMTDATDADSGLPIFDYCDNLTGSTLLLQVGDLALVYVIDDCGGTAGMLSRQLEKLPKSISTLQLREIFARYAVANLHIRNRPVFRTEFAGALGPRITVDLPPFEIEDFRPEVFGEVLAHVVGGFAGNISVDGAFGEDAIRAIQTGRVSFLFDKDGNLRE